MIACCGRLPFERYRDTFNPIEVAEEVSDVRSLSDDLGDIYGDVVAGLRAYRNGNRAGAVWEWRFGMRSHWGAHATSAIRALHWWLAVNAEFME